MAHFAWLDANSTVYQVSVVDNVNLLDENGDESEAVGIAYLTSVHGEGKTWKQTSYNTQYVYECQYDDSEPPQVIGATIVGSTHTQGGTPFRGKYAGIGDTYDAVNDVFVSPTIESDE
jgi:hypothetical protein